MLFGLMTPVTFHLAVTSKILLPLLGALLSVIFKQGFTLFFLLFNSEIKQPGGHIQHTQDYRIVVSAYSITHFFCFFSRLPASPASTLGLLQGYEAKHGATGASVRPYMLQQSRQL